MTPTWYATLSVHVQPDVDAELYCSMQLRYLRQEGQLNKRVQVDFHIQRQVKGHSPLGKQRSLHSRARGDHTRFLIDIDASIMMPAGKQCQALAALKKGLAKDHSDSLCLLGGAPFCQIIG